MSTVVDWILGVEDLVVRAPGVLTRLGVGSITLAKDTKVAFDSWEDSTDDIFNSLPFFVVREAAVGYHGPSGGDAVLDSAGGVEIVFRDEAQTPGDHKASKVDFANFFYGVLDWIALNQGKEISGFQHIPINLISVSGFPTRTPIAQRDAARAASDNWTANALLSIGDGQ